ncbi:MAG: MMPL family transporter, partial [Chloroflexota bacterium]|nr:MMPL family transporter [Chloroflexota bacterium]
LSIFVLLAALYRRDRLVDAKKTEAKEPKRILKPRNKFTLGPEVASAVLTLGLVGLGIVFIATEPSFTNIGFAIGIGITVFAILASTISLGIELHRERLGIMAPGKEAQKRRHVVDSALNRLGPWVVKHPLIIIPIALTLTVAGLVSDNYIQTETDQLKFISQDLTVIENLQAVEEVAGNLASLNVMVEAEDVTDPEILDWMLQLEDRINEEQLDLITGTQSVGSALQQVIAAIGGETPQTAEEVKNYLGVLPSQIKSNLITEDYTAANIIATIGDMSGEQVRETKEILESYASDHPEGVEVAITGMPLMSAELLNSLGGGRVQMTLIGFGFIVGGLLLLFRFNFLKVAMAVLPIALIIGWSSGIMFLAGIKYTPATATMGALIIGIGVEFTILLMMRYYEERDKGEGPAEAMITAIKRIGRAIIASGLTVIGGFGALLIAQNFPILCDFGIVTIVNVLFALVSTLIVLPALIVWIDSWREKRRLARGEIVTEDNRIKKLTIPRIRLKKSA